MAVETRRGCGYRKIGAMYLVGQGMPVFCDRLPYKLEVCKTCGNGIKQTQGWTWVDWFEYAGRCEEQGPCKCELGFSNCGICNPEEGARTGLLWVGGRFYTPAAFIQEASQMGISKRIAHIPKGLKLGETWVLLAHPRGTEEQMYLSQRLGNKLAGVPAIFYAFRPTKIEMLVTEEQSNDGKFMDDLFRKKISAVIVPGGDPDHQGSVYEENGNGDED